MDAHTASTVLCDFEQDLLCSGGSSGPQSPSQLAYKYTIYIFREYFFSVNIRFVFSLCLSKQSLGCTASIVLCYGKVRLGFCMEYPAVAS